MKLAVLAGLSVAVFLVAMAVMFFSAHIGTVLGATGISIVQKLMGLILSAMAVQFIFNGLREMGVLG